jgi:hypothetical protein
MVIRNPPLLETRSAYFLKALELGTVSTNVYLRRIHNFALDMNWLPWSILPKRQWPKVKFKEKLAIPLEEHQQIIADKVTFKHTHQRVMKTLPVGEYLGEAGLAGAGGRLIFFRDQIVPALSNRA